MVNQTILDYLRRYSSMYPLEQVKQKILSSGYSEKEFDEAYLEFRARNSEQTSEIRQTEEKLNYSNKKFKLIKTGGIFAIIFLLSFVLSFIFILVFPQSSQFLSISLIALFFISILSLVFFFLGFSSLGKKYNKKMIRVVSRVIVIFLILFIIALCVGVVFLILYPETVKNIVFEPFFNAFSSTTSIEDVLSLISVYLLAIIGVYFVLFVLGILFSIGLILLRKDVKLANASGILNIIGIVLSSFGIGILLLFIAFVFEIVILLREAR